MPAIAKRPATDAELHDFARTRAGLIRFRHFVREVSSARAKNGVAHRQYTRGTVHWSYDRQALTVAGGKHKGEALTATHCTLPDGSTFLADVRIASPYLPTNV